MLRISRAAGNKKAGYADDRSYSVGRNKEQKGQHQPRGQAEPLKPKKVIEKAFPAKEERCAGRQHRNSPDSYYSHKEKMSPGS